MSVEAAHSSAPKSRRRILKPSVREVLMGTEADTVVDGGEGRGEGGIAEEGLCTPVEAAEQLGTARRSSRLVLRLAID